MKQIVRDYFTFNKRERRGIFVLLCLLALLIVYHRLAPYFVPDEAPEMSFYAKELEEIDRKLKAAEDSADDNYDAPDYKAEPEKYYRKKKKVYPAKKMKPAFVKEYPRKQVVKPAVMLELNSADTLQLDQLPGIGPAFARRIVKYRELLGGFVSMEQLLEVYGFDTARLGLIRSRLELDTSSARKLNINTATLEELAKHPYIRYPLAKAIVNYRKQHGPYGSVEALRSIVLLKEEGFRKLSPYLRTE